MVPKQAGFYGKTFKASRGVRQGDIMSPIIFNITTDAVIRESLKQFYDIYPNDTDTQAIFYADDGVLCGNDAEKIQFLLDIFATNFARIGLKMNVGNKKC
jgi:Reverse transcriptase (RNA-dependent DNA polymerase)